MRGIKLYPPQGFYPSDPACLDVCRAIQELGVPVLMHMGRVLSHPGLRSKYARPIYLEELGLACPRLRLIIGHFASPWAMEACHIAMSWPQWAYDLTTSGSWDPAVLRHVCGLPWDPGIKRFVLGTDGDGANNLDIARATRERLAAWGFTEDELDLMFHHNGLRVLGRRSLVSRPESLPRLPRLPLALAGSSCSLKVPPVPSRCPVVALVLPGRLHGGSRRPMPACQSGSGQSSLRRSG